MSSYWSADDSVRVGETKISVPSENGLNYSPGQKIQIYVDPSTKFIDGRECYIDLDFQISLPSGATDVPTRLQLDKCSSTLFKNIRIYDGSRSQLLEELSEYASYVSVKYDYDKDINIENMRALREGCAVYTPANRATEGTTQTPMSNTITNPYFKKTTGNQTTEFSDSDFLKAKLCLPLHTGIFQNSETIFPVMMTNGLYIEIDINSAPAILNQLDSVNRNRRTEGNPYFHSLNGSTAPNNWANGATSNKFFVSRRNNLGGADSVDKFPMVVGETINFCKSDNNGSEAILDATATISEINLSTAADGGAGLIEVVLDATLENDGVAITSENFVLFSTACDGKNSYDASFTVSNVNLILSQVHLDPAYERGMMQKVRDGGAIEFDIMTLTNYKHSILASDRQTTFQIFANQSRAKSLVIVPQDSSVYDSAGQICGQGGYVIKGSDETDDVQGNKDEQDTCLINDRSAHSGIVDYLSSVQYQINGKRVPSREISTKKIATRLSIDTFHLFEIEKALDNAEIAPRSFSEFQNNFVLGRGFSAGGQKGAMDLRGKDLAVILKYNESTAPTKPKMFNSFVFGLRRLIIRDGAIDIVF